ncbi:hypothetical protein X797_001918 [Metarhizium robertsii]|uniref:Uncharacterized protein n=1 Tax=Metarhizium robertsii TaxID=568076 RepID=A0A0A1V306_9HYPO|nr:hypothetical protein X797_001918 [Metarhizium robertsii]
MTLLSSQRRAVGFTQLAFLLSHFGSASARAPSRPRESDIDAPLASAPTPIGFTKQKVPQGNIKTVSAATLTGFQTSHSWNMTIPVFQYLNQSAHIIGPQHGLIYKHVSAKLTWYAKDVGHSEQNYYVVTINRECLDIQVRALP